LTGKFIYRIFIAVFLLTSSVYASVVSVQVQPGAVHPGDIFALSIGSGGSALAQAEFLHDPVQFHTVKNGDLIAFVPVDINTAPGQYPVYITRGADRLRAEIKLVPREVRTIHLTVSEEKVTLSPADQKRVDREFQLQKNIWEGDTPASWNGQFLKPTGTETSTEFGVKRIFNNKRTSVHRGIDFRGKTGAPVRAINAGTVVLSRELFYGGNTLIIDHGMGLYSVYMHMSGFKVREGEKVTKAQVVGLVGSSGRVTGPHLHLSVKLNGVSVDPESLFKLKL
jgi:murein DD-endopeptidase MepM/ murein hydrolase activator NlpD